MKSERKKFIFKREREKNYEENDKNFNFFYIYLKKYWFIFEGEKCV